MASGETYPNRNALHRNMGPPDSCARCYGRGWYLECDENGEDQRERYCDCECGTVRREVEGGDADGT